MPTPVTPVGSTGTLYRPLGRSWPRRTGFPFPRDYHTGKYFSGQGFFDYFATNVRQAFVPAIMAEG